MLRIVKGFLFMALATCHVIPVAPVMETPCVFAEFRTEGLRYDLVPRLDRDIHRLLKTYCDSVGKTDWTNCTKFANKQEIRWPTPVDNNVTLVQLNYMRAHVARAIELIREINRTEETNLATPIRDYLKNVDAILEEQLKHCNKPTYEIKVNLPQRPDIVSVQHFLLGLMFNLRKQVFLLKTQIEYTDRFPYSQEVIVMMSENCQQ